MTAAQLALVEQSAFERFVDAVYALSDKPGPVTLVRYLAASRALEESRRSEQTSSRARPRSASRTTGPVALIER